MLSLRPTCEHCNTSLDPAGSDAMICTFECTFCKDCSTELLKNVCPNCNGNLVERPARPMSLLKKYPSSQEIVHKPVTIEKHQKKLKKK